MRVKGPTIGWEMKKKVGQKARKSINEVESVTPLYQIVLRIQKIETGVRTVRTGVSTL